MDKTKGKPTLTNIEKGTAVVTHPVTPPPPPPKSPTQQGTKK